jgi:hypothetical protein
MFSRQLVEQSLAQTAFLEDSVSVLEKSLPAMSGW